MENNETKAENQNQDLGQDEFHISNPEKIRFAQPEWVFQFDEDEPIVFAWSEQPDDTAKIIIEMKGESNSTLFFKSTNGKTFKIFSREITEPTLKMLEQNIIIN